jgi:hypothetical protein
MTINIDTDRAADSARAHEILEGVPPEDRAALCDIIRRWIAGLSAEATDAAIVELFAEIQTGDEVWREECRAAREARPWGPSAQKRA